MKNENEELSRRNFLTKGAAVAAVSSIISIETLAAPSAESKANTGSPAAAAAAGVTVTTTGVQTLTNKTIPSRQNILGTDYVNIREYPITGTDITSALNSAIAALTSSSGSVGGQILIPHGIWTSNGGHTLTTAISVEGVGFSGNPGGWGTDIKLNSGGSTYMFRITTESQHCALRNLSIDLRSKTSGIGLLMTDHDNGADLPGGSVYETTVENVGFNGGSNGIKVDSRVTSASPYVTTNFECILNRFQDLSFIGCQTAFYCNSVNGGFSFDNCYFSLPTTAGTALDCLFMGNLSVEHCLFVGNSPPVPNVPPTDGSTILKTLGVFNNINFYDCQDEGVQYYYQNSTNFFDYVPLVFTNCLIQAGLRFTASGSVIFDSCRINITDISTTGTGGARVTDSETAYVRLYLKGATNLFWHVAPPPPTPLVTQFDKFINPYSQVIYESTEVGKPEIVPIATVTPTYIINKTRGAVNIGAGTSYVVIYNNLITPDSLVFAQQRTFDPGGAKIREVACNPGYIQINLTQNAAATLGMGFKVEG